ncbi:MAG: glycosyltransferase [Pasteurella multocida]|nr:glycosyltransferase [Pasteurella multocida]
MGVRVLLIHKWLVSGGVERILINYLSIFSLLNYKTDLLIQYNLNENNFFEEKIKNNINYDFIFKNTNPERTHKKQKINILYKVKKELKKILKEIEFNKIISNRIKDYDIVIDFNGCLDKSIRYNSKFIKNKIITLRWIHNQLDIHKNKKIKKYNNIFSKHTKVITICNEMKDRITHQLQYNKNNIHVIHNPINIEEIKEYSEQQVEDEKLIKDKYILQVSRLVEGKGHIELLEIYAKLKSLGIQHKLYFIGEGENRINLENKIRELNLVDDCILLGEISNPYPYFKNADLFVHTSESEGLPTVLLESMVLGIPVVAMNCLTGPKDILGQNSEYGKLVPLHDQDSFISAVFELLTKRDVWLHYSEKSIVRSKDFSVEKISLEIDKLFKEITQNNFNK